MPKAAKRIYVVNKNRLVRAYSPASAIRHTHKEDTATVAGQDDLVKLIAQGVQVEDVGQEEGEPL